MARTGALTVRVLGPVLAITADGTELDLPSASQRRLLAVLALHHPNAIRSSWLCDVLELTPGALRQTVARLRRVLGEALRTTTGGYRLDAEVDATQARRGFELAGHDREQLAGVIALWVGQTLEEFRDESWAVGDVRRLDEVRAAAIEDLAELRLNAGDHDRATHELDAHIADYPYRDRPRALLMRALAGAGRRTEALRAFREYRTTLGEEVGTEPSDALVDIERRIATGWDGIDSVATGADRDAPQRHDALLDDALDSNAAGVGREHALAQLVEAAETSSRDGVSVVVVAGEAGIGKTTLVADFGRALAGTWDVAYGRFDEHVGAPFSPLDDIVGRLAAHLPHEQLARHAARYGGDLVRLAPALADRLGAPAATPADERTARQLLLDAVTDVVARSARLRPLLLAVDDLQWSGPASALLLRHLARHLRSAPVLLVLTIRTTADALPDHARELLADLARERLDRIELAGLDREELAALVRARIEAAQQRDVGPVVDALSAETAGNALFADQLLAHWSRTGRLTIGDTDARVARRVDVDVPPTVRDLVWQRVRSLGDRAADVLSAAAVLGTTFDEATLAAMTQDDDESVTALLDRAISAGVLVEDAGAVRFAHTLVEHALEADLPARHRRSMHGRAYEALLTTHGETRDLAPRLAHHAQLADRPDDMLERAIQAGDVALADLAPDEATRWYTTAVEVATRLGRPDAQRADLLVRLGEARAFAGHPSAIDALTEGAALAARVGAGPVVVRAALAADRGTIMLGQPSEDQLSLMEQALRASADADLATRARLTASVALRLVRTDRARDRRALADEALQLARATEDPEVFGAVAVRVLHALWAPGAARRRHELAREATAAVDHVDDPDLLFLVFFTAYGAAVCAADDDAARDWAARVREVADDVRDPHLRWALGVLDGFEAIMSARFDDAERIIAATADRGMQLGAEQTIVVFTAQSFVLGTYMGRHAELLPIVEQGLDTADVQLTFRLAHAIVSCETGHTDRAAELLESVMRGEVERTPSDVIRLTEVLGLVVVALELGDVEAAAWLLPQVEPFVDEVSFNSITSHGPVAAYVGKLLSLLGRTDEAEDRLLDALAINERFGWEYHRATTLFALAQNRHRDQGRLDDEAAAWLRDAQALCAHYGIEPWGERAAALRRLLDGEDGVTRG